jgi:hypothetical protein
MGELEPQPNPYKRKMPSVEVDLGWCALTFTYRSATLYKFDSPDENHDHSHLNHIYCETGELEEDGSDEHTYIFDSPELFAQLEELKFPLMVLPYPTQADVDLYVDYQMSALEAWEQAGDDE